MKHLDIIGEKIVVCTACLAMVASCTDWNDHYESTGAGLNEQSLYEVLAANAETEAFARIAQEAGYDDILSASQSYTVFAPTNSALADFDVSNGDDARELMENHIARYLWPADASTGKGVRMLNGKIYYFDSPSSFSGTSITSADNVARNGLVHHLSAQIPFVYNIYEYIGAMGNTTKIYDFIHSFDELKFDSENSIEIDIDRDGHPVYDTITVKYNRLLEDKLYGLGNITSEDSLYTMILPDNVAWDAAYERISPSFKVYNQDQGTADSIQDVRTKLAIVDDLIFRGAYPSPTEADSLITTSGSIVKNLSSLFGSTAPVKASNGYVFPLSELNYDNVQTWNKPIIVEAEEQNGRTYNNTTTSLYTRTPAVDATVEASGGSYIEVQPLTASSNPSVVFDIPDVLAGTYNVYAVFLPSNVAGHAEEPDSTKLSFTIAYLNENGRQTSKSVKTSNLITDSQEITTMLAFENFEFPVSDFTDNLWLMEEGNEKSDVAVNTQLTISTNVTTSEYTKGTYSRTFRLDRIILSPAKK